MEQGLTEAQEKAYDEMQAGHQAHAAVSEQHDPEVMLYQTKTPSAHESFSDLVDEVDRDVSDLEAVHYHPLTTETLLATTPVSVTSKEPKASDSLTAMGRAAIEVATLSNKEEKAYEDMQAETKARELVAERQAVEAKMGLTRSAEVEYQKMEARVEAPASEQVETQTTAVAKETAAEAQAPLPWEQLVEDTTPNPNTNARRQSLK